MRLKGWTTRLLERIIATLLILLMTIVGPSVLNAQTKAQKVAPSQPVQKAAAAPRASGPSLEETLKWLAEFLPTATGAEWGSGRQTRTTSMQYHGCHVTLVLNNARTDDSPGFVVRVEQSFSLADIDAGKVKAHAGEFGTNPLITTVGMRTRSDAKTVAITHTYPGSNSESSEFRESAASAEYFGDKVSADRVVNAFSHAAELCAKAEPF